ncbi:hypothetical protein B0H10DRAFT_1952249 [Mycena sp. CBHHK59/15]|nr:hypothetical protein B0H10DRAFT_1952249 [Mycena sp. CBHHK59/15]
MEGLTPDGTGDKSPVENWQVGPSSTSRKHDWAYIRANLNFCDSTRNLNVIYKQPHEYPHAPSSIFYAVGVWAQGFVDWCDLRALGTWSENTSPHSALQFVVLSRGKDRHDVFTQYKAAMQEITDYTYFCLNEHPHPSTRVEYESMHIGWQVFTKCPRTSDNPEGRVVAIDNYWHITSKASVGMHIPNNVDQLMETMFPATPLAELSVKATLLMYAWASILLLR